MSVADKLHQRQMALRKKSGLPHPDYYKELGHSYNISDDKERLAKQSEIKKKYKVESVEQLDEMPESSMKTRDVHAHLRKSGWTLKRTGGGHDVYSHPKSKEHIAVPRHKQLKAPLIRGIMKASRVTEETEIEEQLEKKGRFVSGPPKKTFKAPTIVSPIKEAKDAREYDYEGDMAMSQLRSLIFNAEDMMDLMDENTNLPEWVQSKVTLAEDYISTAANYLRGELTEEVKLNEGRPSQRHPLEGHEYHKKSDEALIHIAKDAHAAAEAMKGHNTQAENKYRDQANDSATVRHFRKKSGMPDWYKRKYGHVKEDIEYLEEKNVPTSPEKWAQAKAQAKSKFDVYPSAYANGWAAKKYKEMGGGWKSVNENTDDPSAAARTLSRKAQIVRDAAKGRKQDQEQASDKFQKDPELSSDIQKT
jgi:predicted RNA binding protein YcfA (HicA-like mRNA interferase family)